MRLISISIVALLLLCPVAYQASAQTTAGKSPIKWYTLEQAMQLRQEQNRPLFIDVYTDWCGWCKKMMNTTFADPQLAGYIQNNYYPVRFDAETRDTIEFEGKAYYNTGKGRRPTHALAKELLNNKLTYPTVVIIDTQGKRFPIAGYIEPKDGLPIASYFAEGNHQSVKFDEYRAHYKQALQYRQTGKSNSLVQWKPLNKALGSKQDEKGLLLLYYTDWNMSSFVLMNAVMQDSSLAASLNEHFLPVRINATTRDTLFFGQEYVNTGKAPSYHQLPVAMLQGQMKFPALLFFNQEKKLLQVVQQFLTPEILQPLIEFYGTEAYKETDWPAYRDKKVKGKR